MDDYKRATDIRRYLAGLLIILSPALAGAQALDREDTADASAHRAPDLQHATLDDRDLVLGYVPDRSDFDAPEHSPSRDFPELRVAVAYAPGQRIERPFLAADTLQPGDERKVKLREQVVDWVRTRSPTAGAVTYLLVAKPDNGWHLAIDPGDEVMLEWNVEF